MSKVDVKLSTFIGSTGNAWERVSMAFRVYGCEPPAPDVKDGNGAYVLSIVEQYQANLSQVEVYAIIRYALTHTRGDLQQLVASPQLRPFSLEELVGLYG